MSIICKECGANEYVKNGFVLGVQRYKCKECGTNFIEGDKRQKYTAHGHLKVIKLYLENCGIRTIERLTGVKQPNSKWIEETAWYIKTELEKTQNSINSIKDICHIGT